VRSIACDEEKRRKRLGERFTGRNKGGRDWGRSSQKDREKENRRGYGKLFAILLALSLDFNLMHSLWWPSLKYT
jgi:hypothetical protein